MNDSLQVLQHEIDAAARQACTTEPDDLCRLRTGKLASRAGSYGQYFSTWVIAHGMLRDYAMYTLYPRLRLAREPQFDTKHVGWLFREFDPPYTIYLGYSGLESLSRFSSRLRELLDTPMAKDEMLSVLVSLTRYANQLTAWSHHYFPWNLGFALRYEEDGEPIFTQEGIRESKVRTNESQQATQVSPARKIRLSWNPPGIHAFVFLADRDNPELCDEFASILPFTALQDHAVVTGKSMYAWAPIVSFAPVRTRERICDAPVGRLRFSQSTGNKLIIQYGETTETLLAPVLGHIVEEDLDVIKEIGHLVWKSTFETKTLVWLHVSAA